MADKPNRFDAEPAPFTLPGGGLNVVAPDAPPFEQEVVFDVPDEEIQPDDPRYPAYIEKLNEIEEAAIPEIEAPK